MIFHDLLSNLKVFTISANFQTFWSLQGINQKFKIQWVYLSTSFFPTKSTDKDTNYSETFNKYVIAILCDISASATAKIAYRVLIPTAILCVKITYSDLGVAYGYKKSELASCTSIFMLFTRGT